MSTVDPAVMFCRRDFTAVPLERKEQGFPLDFVVANVQRELDLADTVTTTICHRFSCWIARGPCRGNRRSG